jgi:hypothetical protein
MMGIGGQQSQFLTCRVVHHPQAEKSGAIVELTVDILLGASEVNGLDTANLLLGSKSRLGGGNGTSTDETAGGSSEGALLDARSGNLTGQLRANALGKGSGSHCEGCDGM